VLALTAAMHPEPCPRVRELHQHLLALLQGCENDLGTYDTRCCPGAVVAAPGWAEVYPAANLSPWP